MKRKILIGVPPKAHVTLALDEVNGLTKAGYNCQTVSYGRNNQSISTLNKFAGVIWNAVKISKSLHRFKPDYLYLNSRFEPAGSTRDFISILIIRLLYFRKLKIAVKSHGSDYTVLLRKNFLYKNLVIPFLEKTVNAWFFLSQEEKKLIEDNNTVIGKKVHVTANIINPERSLKSDEFKAKYQLSNNKFNFLFVGRMVRVKGIFYILQSIPLLKNRESCFFTFVGSGDDFEEAGKISRETGIMNNVQFTGFIQDEECDHFYANTDALVFPTYDTEGFPMALFKSVALGMPVITTNIRAAKDYLKEPDNVIWVKEQSAQAIAAAVDKLIADTELRKNMSLNNCELGKEFTAENVCKQMHEVFAVL